MGYSGEAAQPGLVAAGTGMLHSSVPRGSYQVSGVESVSVPKHRAKTQDRILKQLRKWGGSMVA